MRGSRGDHVHPLLLHLLPRRALSLMLRMLLLLHLHVLLLWMTHSLLHWCRLGLAILRLLAWHAILLHVVLHLLLGDALLVTLHASMLLLWHHLRSTSMHHITLLLLLLLALHPVLLRRLLTLHNLLGLLRSMLQLSLVLPTTLALHSRDLARLRARLVLGNALLLTLLLLVQTTCTMGLTRQLLRGRQRVRR